MDPITAGIIMGGATGALSYLGQRETNTMNRENMQSQMAFQANMSDTAHTREVADLKNAGLNPILSAGGSGASTPTGSMAEMNSPLSSLSGAISTGANTAMALRDQNQKLQIGDKQLGKMGSEIANTDADTETKKLNQALIEQQKMSTAMDIQQKKMSNTVLQKTLDAQVKKANAEGNYAEVNQLMGIINSGASSASQLISPLKMMLPFKQPSIPIKPNSFR